MIFELIVTVPVEDLETEEITIQDVDLTEYVLSYKEQASYNLEQFPIGQVPSKMVNIKLDNGDGNLSDFISADDLLWTIRLGDAIGKYKVVERPEKYTGVIEVTFQDLILETEQPYKSVLEYPTVIETQLAEMASIMGIQIDSSTLSAATRLTEVNWIDTRVSIRDYLSWIAELDAKNVEIDDQSVIKFKEILDTPVHTTEDVESFVFDKQYSISKIIKDDGVSVLEVGSEDGYVLFLQSNNGYITTESQVAAIYDSLAGKSWHSVNDFKMVGYDKLKLGDVIESGDIKFIAMSIDTTWSGGQYAIQVIQGPITPGNIQRTISVYDDRARINRIQTIINEQEQELTILAEKQDETSSEVSALTINSSEISARVSSVEDNLEDYKDEVARQGAEITIEKEKISSLVSETGDMKQEYRDEFGVIGDKYTDLEQRADRVELTVAHSNGLNLLQNSVMYNDSNFWDHEDGLRGETNAWSLTKTSKHCITGEGMNEQTISVVSGNSYAISFDYIKQTAAGLVRVYYILNNERVNILEQTDAADGTMSIFLEDITGGSLTVGIEMGSISTTQPAYIANLMVAKGEVYEWSPAIGEIYTINVLIDEAGVKVKNIDGNAYTAMTPYEFAHYYDREKVFSFDRQIAQVQDLLVKGKTFEMAGGIKWINDKTINKTILVNMRGGN